MSVHTDCVEDVDTLLSDICFNEDLYAKPPTVEFTVVESNQNSQNNLRRNSAGAVGVSSVVGSKGSGNNVNGVNGVNSNGGSGSSSSSSSSSSSTYSTNSTNSNISSTMIRDSSSVLGNRNINDRDTRTEALSALSALSSLSSTAPRVKKILRPIEPKIKEHSFSAQKEVPFDHDEDKDITVYVTGRNRVVYYGISGSPYYITDSGTNYSEYHTK